MVERIVESLTGGSNEAGRNVVNAEQASTDYQPKGVWEGRAGHIAAKAMHGALVPGRASGFPGVVAAAWFEGKVLEDGKRTQAELGTPQGGNASPLLDNIYLHSAIDL